MLAQFSVIPLGVGDSLSEKIAGIVDIVDRSGLEYKLTAMGTIVEGNWDELMELLNRCRQEALKSSDRVYITVAIDDRMNKSGRITSKPDSVQRRLGRPIRQ
ncbi:MAG: MTH1187 family thiamine-binding protein [Nitrospirae bacterium]|nr:MTH1187 family thiamine-binding protein [Nitrospirota bacterium]